MEQMRGYHDDRNFQRGLELPMHFFKLFSTQFLVEMLTAILHALHYGIHFLCTHRNDSR